MLVADVTNKNHKHTELKGSWLLYSGCRRLIEGRGARLRRSRCTKGEHLRLLWSGSIESKWYRLCACSRSRPEVECRRWLRWRGSRLVGSSSELEHTGNRWLLTRLLLLRLMTEHKHLRSGWSRRIVQRQRPVGIGRGHGAACTRRGTCRLSRIRTENVVCVRLLHAAEQRSLRSAEHGRLVRSK